MDNDNRLIGKWSSTSQEYGDVQMEFLPDGRLIYSIRLEGKSQFIFLKYWTKDAYLYTDQSSAPRVERTRFHFDGDKLVLDFEGKISMYERVKDEA